MQKDYQEQNNIEGLIKFDCICLSNKTPSPKKISELNNSRNMLYNLNLIGVNPQGIGFGNISKRISDNEFLITASNTGRLKVLTAENYCIIKEYDLQNNKLKYEGLSTPSCESLTHACIYESDNEINCVIHVHNNKLWKKLIDKVPTTSEKATCGSIELCSEIYSLLKNPDSKEKKIIAMKGHQDGVITFGKNITSARKILMHYLDK